MNIGSLTGNLNTYLEELKEGDGALNYLTKNQNFVKDLDSTLTNIKQATYRLNENMEALKSNFFFRGYFKKLEKEKAKEEKEKLKN